MFLPWDLISQCGSAQEEGLVRGRPHPTAVLSVVGAKMREASSTSPCHSQVTENLGGSLPVRFSPPGYDLHPTFLQGGLPRTQDKDTHLPPLPPSLMVEDASSSTGKRQTCDIEGALWGQWGLRDQRDGGSGIGLEDH